MYYLIQWLDKETGIYHDCSQMGQLEIFDSLHKAQEVMKQWGDQFGEGYSIAEIQIDVRSRV